jgi:hypothetical protein
MESSRRTGSEKSLCTNGLLQGSIPPVSVRLSNWFHSKMSVCLVELSSAFGNSIDLPFGNSVPVSFLRACGNGCCRATVDARQFTKGRATGKFLSARVSGRYRPLPTIEVVTPQFFAVRGYRLATAGLRIAKDGAATTGGNKPSKRSPFSIFCNGSATICHVSANITRCPP